MARLRNYFLTGFVVCAPLAITAWITWSFMGWVDGWVKPYIPARYTPETYLPFSLPGFGLVVALVLITFVGFVTAGFVGRRIVGAGENVLGRMPLVRTVYTALKQIFETVLADRSSSFKQAGLIEYPRRGLWAVVFVATTAKGEVRTLLSDQGEELFAVFLPPTPNPTAGYLLFVPKQDVRLLSMPVEDALKMVVSAGLVTPPFEEASLDGAPERSRPVTSAEAERLVAAHERRALEEAAE